MHCRIVGTIVALSILFSAAPMAAYAQADPYEQGMMDGWVELTLDTAALFDVHLDSGPGEDYNRGWANTARSYVGTWRVIEQTAADADLSSDLADARDTLTSSLDELAAAGDAIIEGGTGDDADALAGGLGAYADAIAPINDLVSDGIVKYQGPSESAPATAPAEESEGDEAQEPVLRATGSDPVSSDQWTISVTNASYILDLNMSYAYIITLELEVTNNGAESRSFGRPDMSFTITASDGRDFEDDLFMSAQLQALDEWTGPYAPDATYNTVLAFAIPEADPNVFPDDPSGWVLTIVDGDTEYFIDLEFSNEPPTR